MKFTIELTWEDNSETMFQVELKGKKHEIMSVLTWITRGTLMATSAKRAIAYNEEGFDVISYIQ